jgi:hypothetical protein
VAVGLEIQMPILALLVRLIEVVAVVDLLVVDLE